MTKATSKQVRDLYKSQGYEVRISKDGHVTFRQDGGEWREGRWVSEYRVFEGRAVLA